MYFPQLAWTLGTAFVRPKLGLLDESVVPMRVWPDDLDFNLHMNNARYLTAMERGRWDLAVRQGWAGKIVQYRWQILVGGVTVRYRRALKPFESYRLRTRLAGWNAKWCYIEHTLERANGDIAAQGGVRGVFRGAEGNVPVRAVFERFGFTAPVEPPALPAWMSAWAQGDAR